MPGPIPGRALASLTFPISPIFRLTELKGGLLTKMLIEATRTDPIAPILHKKHIEAINRRMPLIFSTLAKCVTQNGMDAVIVDNWSGLPRENT